jgi:hypothetical protein
VSTLRVPLAMIAALVGLLLTVPILVVVLPFVGISSLTRLLRFLLEPRFAQWGDLLEFNPIFGWQSRALLNTYHIADDVFHLTTDAQGWRGKSSLVESDIVVFGDSFAWGYGIDDKHFFADLHPHLHIKAIGTIGYNMVQELLWMQHVSSQLAGKLVVWFIYFGNDLYENVLPHMYHYRMPFVRENDETGEWEIVRSHISPQPWRIVGPDHGGRYYPKLAELCSPTFVAHRAYAACEFLIRQGKDICCDNGARLVVMTIPDVKQLSHSGTQWLRDLSPMPHAFDVDFPDQNIERICNSLEVQFIALKNHLDVSHHKTYDVHWNEFGHRQVAHLLERLYCSNKALVL